ncbi:ATP-binding protein [Streptomyces sp. NPDC054796]
MNVIEEPTEFPPRRYRIALTVGDHSPRHMRRIARAYVRLWDVPQLGDTVELALTELMTNVHRHVPDQWCTVTILHTLHGVRIEVYDRSPVLPVPREAETWEESGRGLALVALLSDQWDVTAHATGKTVWCEVCA